MVLLHRESNIQELEEDLSEADMEALAAAVTQMAELTKRFQKMEESLRLHADQNRSKWDKIMEKLENMLGFTSSQESPQLKPIEFQPSPDLVEQCTSPLEHSENDEISEDVVMDDVSDAVICISEHELISLLESNTSSKPQSEWMIQTEDEAFPKKLLTEFSSSISEDPTNKHQDTVVRNLKVPFNRSREVSYHMGIDNKEIVERNIVFNCCTQGVRQNANEKQSVYVPPAKPPDELVYSVNMLILLCASNEGEVSLKESQLDLSYIHIGTIQQDIVIWVEKTPPFPPDLTRNVIGYDGCVFSVELKVIIYWCFGELVYSGGDIMCKTEQIVGIEKHIFPELADTFIAFDYKEFSQGILVRDKWTIRCLNIHCLQMRICIVINVNALRMERYLELFEDCFKFFDCLPRNWSLYFRCHRLMDAFSLVDGSWMSSFLLSHYKCYLAWEKDICYTEHDTLFIQKRLHEQLLYSFKDDHLVLVSGCSGQRFNCSYGLKTLHCNVNKRDMGMKLLRCIKTLLEQFVGGFKGGTTISLGMILTKIPDSLLWLGAFYKYTTLHMTSHLDATNPSTYLADNFKSLLVVIGECKGHVSNMSCQANGEFVEWCVATLITNWYEATTDVHWRYLYKMKHVCSGLGIVVLECWGNYVAAIPMKIYHSSHDMQKITWYDQSESNGVHLKFHLRIDFRTSVSHIEVTMFELPLNLQSSGYAPFEFRPRDLHGAGNMPPWKLLSSFLRLIASSDVCSQCLGLVVTVDWIGGKSVYVSFYYFSLPRPPDVISFQEKIRIQFKGKIVAILSHRP